VFLVEVTPPDENGFCNFGSWVWERARYARRAKTVIAEINDSLTRNYGDTFLHISEIDHLVEFPVPPLTEEEIETIVGRFPAEKYARARKEIGSANPRFIRNVIAIIDEVPLDMLELAFNMDEPDDMSRAIAENLKTVLRDRDTIQIGVGKPSRFMVDLGVFDNFHDLSIFSEMACPGMGFLVKRGIVTGKYASLHPGKAVFSGLGGMRREEILWTHNNPLIELYGSDYVLDITNIARNKNMVSINNAMQVDLTGQITAESQFGPRLINGPGGQIEFHMGAFIAPGGRSITLLPSTWGNGEVSNIVSHMAEGSLVTISRAYADIVITEWGVAHLAGKTHHKRAHELIRVAHPDFRADLTKAAQEIW
jgi:4-hydroxybutyrate CoA-transferase